MRSFHFSGLVAVLLTLFGPAAVSGFAEWFTSEEYCERKLLPGEIIMNEAAFVSKERGISVRTADGTVLTSGQRVTAGSTLTLVPSDITGQWVFDVTSDNPRIARFDYGGCRGQRISGEKEAALRTVVTRASDEETMVEIRLGWSAGHMAVRITEPFLLYVETPKELMEGSAEDDDDDDDDEERLSAVDTVEKEKARASLERTAKSVKKRVMGASARNTKQTGKTGKKIKTLLDDDDDDDAIMASGHHKKGGLRGDGTGSSSLSSLLSVALVLLLALVAFRYRSRLVKLFSGQDRGL